MMRLAMKISVISSLGGWMNEPTTVATLATAAYQKGTRPDSRIPSTIGMV